MGMEVVAGLLRPACCWVPGCCRDPSSVPCVGPNQPETEQFGVSVQPPWVLPLSLLPSVPPAGCSALVLLCQPACVPLCMRVHVCACVPQVHACPSAPTCIMHPCTSLCTVCTVCMLCPCASLCIPVHLCALCACPAPVHPCAPHACGRLRRPHRQRLLLGLAWGSALGTALGGSRRLIPSRCGCREPGSAPPPHRGPRRFGPVPGGAAGAHKAAPARLLHCSWAVYGVLLAALCCSSAALLLAVSAPAFADPELVSQ